MRAFFFTNMYISPIQKGIQTAHCITQMFAKYTGDDGHVKNPMLVDFAKNHMTKIVYDGGNSASLKTTMAAIECIAFQSYFDAHPNGRGLADVSIAELIKSEWFAENWYPYAAFYEDEQSLNGALTCVGIVLPERVYDFADKIRRRIVTVTQLDFLNRDKEFMYHVVCNDGATSRGNISDSDIALALLLVNSRLA